MANVGPKAWYVRDGSGLGYSAVTAWAANTLTAAGILRRPTAPAVGSERVVVSIIGGTTANPTEPTWTTSKGARNTDNTVTWQECTGQPGVNGDIPVSATTNASTAAGSAVLSFASVPANVRVGMLAMHANLPTGASTVTVVSVSATLVVLSGNATGTVASGQAVFFGSCPMWLAEKNTVLTIGLVIYDSVTASLQILSVAGTTGNGAQPSFSATAGTTTTDNTATWTSLGLASNFAKWAAPHAKLQNALASTWGAAGDDFYLGDDHAQTQAANLTLTFPGTGIAPNDVWCVDHTASLPVASAALRSDPYTTSSPACAQVTTTSTGTLTVTGTANVDGVIFNCGTGATAAAASFGGMFGRMNRCSIRKLGTTASSAAIVLPVGDYVGSTLQFGNTGDQVRSSTTALTRWLNVASPAVIGATLPTTLIGVASAGALTIDGVNLSNYGTGKTIVGALTAALVVRLIGIIVGSGVTIAATPTNVNARVEATWVDSSGTNYQQGVWTVGGTLTQETTIVRTGSLSALAWKIVPTANNRWLFPVECPTGIIYNPVVPGTPVTVTMYGTWTGAALPNTDDVWFNIAYFGDASSPMMTMITSTKADNFTPGTALTSDSSAWGGGTTAFKMTATFTPNQRGPIRVVPFVANQINTVYLDPEPVLS